jgi:exosortase/archaeosortase
VLGQPVEIKGNSRIAKSFRRHLLVTLILATTATLFSLGAVVQFRLLAKNPTSTVALLDLTRILTLPLVLGTASVLSLGVMLRISRGVNLGFTRFVPLLLACIAIPIQRLTSGLVAWLA